MYNNTFMNMFAPRCNYIPMQFFMPMQNCMPFRMLNPMMNYYSPVNIFQNYFRPNNYWHACNFAPQSFIVAQPVQNNQNITNNVKYNKQKGELLAKNIVDILPKTQEIPLCAKYVKLAVEKSGLGPYINGNGEACKNIFRANPNFKEIKVKGKDFDKLPKGSIVVYDANSTVKNKNGEQEKIGKDGHVLITIGNGKACSDRLENEIWQTDNAYVFIPV